MKKLYTSLLLLFAVAFQMEVASQAFTPQAGQFYAIKLGGVDSLTFGRALTAIIPTGENDLMKSRLRNPNPAEALYQAVKFEATDTEGQYYIVNGNGEYLYNKTWDMWFHPEIDPAQVGTQKGYKFTVLEAPGAPGFYRIGTVSYGTANRVIGAGGTTINSLTYADKAADKPNLNWTITPVGVTNLSKELVEKGIQVQSYPNPFNGSAVVEVSGKFEYSIYDINGKQVESGNGLNNIKVGSTLTQGMYFLQVKQDNSFRTIRLSKI